ncbi:ATP-binding protein [Massilia sp. TWP1-3-3]|uniref:ATP-binding protein n=1 Tax=Massilia sp. TWP1-3-3 TaxID=2804573 RepID=UPI003CE9BD68
MSSSDLEAPRPPCKRGSLRIYFGAADGVGKTDAMLAAARLLQQQGRDVLVVAPAAGFDLDAALARKPAVVVLGQLASPNPAPARHPRRWQDADELRSAGIDVFTTLNVDQLESLFDVVRAITGAVPAHSLPDTVFDGAEQVVFVDGAPDVPGALHPLRELALRRTAQQAEHAARAHRGAGAGAALLACVAADDQAQHVIRSAARLAGQVNADWHVIHVETPSMQRRGAAGREQLAQAFALARSLGASTTLLAGSDIALMIADYARSQHFSRIVLGRSRRSGALPWRAPQLRRIAAYAPDIDLIETGHASTAPARADVDTGVGTSVGTSVGTNGAPPAQAHPRSRRQRYLLGAGASALTAALTAPLLPYFDLANIAMLFLLTVVLVAVRLGREASVVAAVVSAAALLLSARGMAIGAADLQYSVMFLVMLAVGLITASLTADLRYQARFALQREARSRALYEFARSLSSALQTEQVFEITQAFIRQTFQAHATLLLPDGAARLAYPSAQQGVVHVPVMSVLDMGAAQWAFDRALPAGAGTDTLPGNSFYYLPLVAPMRTRGVLAIWGGQEGAALAHEQRKQLETFAALAAIALERVHYVEVAQDAMVRMESERLRNSLLAALSHDLRTPLTSLVGLSESLALSRPALSEAQAEMAFALRDEAVRMSTLVSNLLDMARMQSGHVRLNLQWQTLEEIAGSALRASRWQLARHVLWTSIAHDLPLVRYDAVLLERVLCNLLENAAKYTPPGSRIGITAQPRGSMMEVTVHDNGPGLPPGREEDIFEKFTRGERESPIPGVGLGLAICRAIVEAHGGAIRAGASPEGGAAFIFSLPLGTPPELPAMDEQGPT